MPWQFILTLAASEDRCKLTRALRKLLKYEISASGSYFLNSSSNSSCENEKVSYGWVLLIGGMKCCDIHPFLGIIEHAAADIADD